ncbi:hypothetical protein CsatB_030133 [Cannabis sativa]|uniref:uncharacterized protein LOC133034383 n=1 Tax=Cannabis sativa TaxID=3483 RepID=UPI0029CA371C|nr:uncharacterized protein LOC133034383 [Cannabis sativa]
MEKLAFALITSSRKLRPYFQAHSIEVLTNYPLRQVLAKPEASGRLLKWAMELIWGIDLIGELPKGKGGVKYAVVTVDYFTKWAEAKALATITATKLHEFVYTSIICRFGIPYKLISDNGRQFDCKEMRQLCDDLGIKKAFSAVAYPQRN